MLLSGLVSLVHYFTKQYIPLQFPHWRYFKICSIIAENREKIATHNYIDCEILRREAHSEEVVAPTTVVPCETNPPGTNLRVLQAKFIIQSYFLKEM